MNDRKGIVRVGDRRYTRGWEHKYEARHAIKGKGRLFLPRSGAEVNAGPMRD